MPHNFLAQGSLLMIVYILGYMATRNGNYVYSQTELDTLLSSIKKLNVKKKTVYLNNDHGMLRNGLYLLKNSR